MKLLKAEQKTTAFKPDVFLFRMTGIMDTKAARKILLVEDEASLKELYRELLFSEGLEVVIAEDGEAALEQIQNDTFDLVLLDIRLPKLDGLQVLKSLSPENRKHAGLIYMMTNFNDEAVIKEAYSLGADGYLMKSALNPAEVLREVQAALGGVS